MLYTRFGSDGKIIEYTDSEISKHELIYNSYRHISGEQVKTLEDMHVIVEGLFRDYPTEIWEIMHVGGLNAYFGPEEYAYGLLSLVNKLTDRSDKYFCFYPLLQALKMCCIMLARFHNLLEKTCGGSIIPFIRELQVAASEIESCINGLQSSNVKMHNCLLIRISAYTLKGVDILLFKSIRIIVFALQLLLLLVNGTGTTGTGFCVVTAFDGTKTFMSNFSTSNEFRMQIPSDRYRALSNTVKLPSHGDTCKIVGMTFIISSAGRLSFSTKIEAEIEKLSKMLAEDN